MQSTRSPDYFPFFVFSFLLFHHRAPEVGPRALPHLQQAGMIMMLLPTTALYIPGTYTRTYFGHSIRTCKDHSGVGMNTEAVPIFSRT